MSQANQTQSGSTISRQLAARLDNLGAEQMVRAVVMLQTGENGGAQSGRLRGQQRAEMLERVRQMASAALPEIDGILERYDGKRLSEDVNALGSITVEATAEGVRALAASEYVKAILEDQAIFSLYNQKAN